MPVYIITTDTIELRLESDIAILASEGMVVSLLQSLEERHAAIGVSLFKVFRETNPEEYAYRVQLSDGRVWKQQIFLLPDATEMTFDVNPPWKMEEFAPFRAIRDEYVVGLCRTYGVSLIRAEWP